MHEITRSRSLGLLASAALTAGAPRAAQAAPAGTIRIATIPSDTFGEPFYGVDAGLFARAGLNVELSIFTNSGAVGTAVAANAADVGIFDVVGISAAVEQGVPLTMFAAGSRFAKETPTALLCVAKASPYKQPRDLAGKTIAVQTLHGLSDAALHGWLTRYGVAVSDIRVVEIPFSQMAPALERGTVDGAVIAEPFLSAAKLSGTRSFGSIFEAIAPSFYQTGWIASPSYLAANAETARKLVDAAYAIARWANAHHDESGTIIAKYAKLDDATARAMARTAYATSLEFKEIQPLLDVASTYGLIKRPIKAAEIVTFVR